MPSPRVSELMDRVKRKHAPASAKYLAAIVLLAMREFAEKHPDKSLVKVMNEVEREWSLEA